MGPNYLPTAGEGPVTTWDGLYAATVVSNNDPLGVGRLQLQIPQVFANNTSGWAVPLGTYYSIPSVGTTVSAMFIGGDPSQPVWGAPLDIDPIVTAAAPPTVTYSTTAPGDPRVNDVWYQIVGGFQEPPQVWTFNSMTDTFSWVTQSSLGTTAIGTGQVTAAQLSAGIVYAGIVDATTITGAHLVGTGAGNEVLVYTGTPATGNIYGSISATNTTDGHSNTVRDGFVSYGPMSGNTGYIQIAANQSTGQPFLVLGPPGVTGSHLDFPFQAWSITANSGAANEQYQSQISGPVNTQQTDQAAIVFFSSSTDKTLDAAGRLYYNDASGGQNLHVNWDFSGTTLYVAKTLTAVHPGSGTSPTNPATVEGWQSVSFGTGFGAGTGTPRYRLEPLGGGLVRLDGTVVTTAATAAGATMFTLPTGYRPTANKRFVGVSSSSGFTAANPGSTSVQVTTGGVVQCTQACSASGQQIVLDGIVFPVD